MKEDEISKSIIILCRLDKLNEKNPTDIILEDVRSLYENNEVHYKARNQ